MRTFFPSQSRGHTLIELLIVVAAIGILSSVVALNFSAFRSKEVLGTASDEIVSLVNEAHSRTLSGEAGTFYGVHFEPTSATLFAGTAYEAKNPKNKFVKIDSTLVLSPIALKGGGSDVFFKPITGETNEYGTLTLHRTDGTGALKIVTIQKTGFASAK